MVSVPRIDQRQTASMTLAVPAASDELSRLSALQRTGVLDTAPEPRFDAIVAAVKALLDVPIALVSLIDRDRQWFKARDGVDLKETPIDTSVCALAIRQSRLFVIHDLSNDPRTCQMSLVTGDAHLRYYAGFPIVTNDGVAIGSVCAIDTKPRLDELTPAQNIAMEALARQAAIEIERNAAGVTEGDAAMPFSVGSWGWDLEAGRLTLDARLARMMGIDPAEAALGLQGERAIEHIHPEDRARLRQAIEDTVAARAPYSCEYRMRLADGRFTWVLAQGRVIRTPDGRPRYFPGAIFDIDARRRQEMRLSALVELNDRLREPGDAADLAQAASKILGRTLDVARAGYGRIDPVAETIDMGPHWCSKGVAPLPPLLHFRDYGSFIDDLKRGETVTLDDVARDPRTADHAAAIHALGVHALVNMPIVEDGKFVALLVVNDDEPRAWSDTEVAFIKEVADRTRNAVERRRTETELGQLNASLEAEVEARTRDLMIAEENLRQSAKMEAVGQLTGGLAHDLNNLLTGVSGAVEMMGLRIAQGRTDTLGRYLGIASESVTRAAALTHRLLAFSRRQTLDPKPTDGNRLIDGISDLLCRTVGPAHPVRLELADDCWPILVDSNQLENALLNLCINARDAMPDGGPIRIESRNRSIDAATAVAQQMLAGDYLAICVSDSGIGMSHEVRRRAFDPFYTTKPLGVGTGLGLSMVYGFVRQSGGQVWIESAEGQGTSVTLYLPRTDVEPVDEASVERQQPMPTSARTILVVDDEAAVRTLMAEAMGDQGHRVLTASDGAEALELLDAYGNTIDLVLTDVGLTGGMNGRQVAEAALRKRPGLKVVFVTGYAEQAVLGAEQLPENMALVTKPFALDALTSRVSSLLGG
ncbi:GAF domain-containing protein [uncultured Sphingomonas sp.]|uniref:GAF domain-containing protein n=1 Tax=uncultured Sphingomonas sp. TaxID=158754 RepID=UPI0025F8D19D|nr:GAF domain-containing protein [uncultured Sphingomonas sp.]